MNAATAPRPARDVRLLALDGGAGHLTTADDLPSFLQCGDVVVVNDAATLPAAIPMTLRGTPLELRLARLGQEANRFDAVVLGGGDHRARTEDRPPPAVAVGDELLAACGLRARVRAVSPRSSRLVEIEVLSTNAATLFTALYCAGRPVQYAHVPERLALWDVQSLWASVPWAFEVPSAGLPLRAQTVLTLRKRGVAVVGITHAAGLSSTGDPALDALLPLPERWRVPRAVKTHLEEIRAAGGRVIAVGTSVVRALETASRAGDLEEGTTDLRIGRDTELRLVDAIVTGIHERGTSHYELLSAFASRETLDRGVAISQAAGLFDHEFGDLWLLWRGDRRSARQLRHHR